MSTAWDETSHGLEVRRRTGYRVDIFLVATQLFQPYSANGIDNAMAESLAEHLKRNHSGGRIVEVPNGRIIKEWEGTTGLEFSSGRTCSRSAGTESMSDFIQRAAAPAYHRAPKKAKKTRSRRPHAGVLEIGIQKGNQFAALRLMWYFASASAICAAKRIVCSDSNGPFVRRCSSVSPSTSPMTRKSTPSC